MSDRSPADPLQPRVSADEAEDEVRRTVERWEELAGEQLATMLGRQDKPEKYEERRGWWHYLSNHQLAHVPALLEAAEDGDLWNAVRYALRIGLMEGHLQAEPGRYHAVRILAPDAARGRKVVESAAMGGRARRKGPPDEVLCAAVAETHDRSPRLSWSRVCELVGNRFSLSRRTVENRARAADWRDDPETPD